MNLFLLLFPDLALIAIGFVLWRKVLAHRMRGGPFVALCITASTFLAVLTLPFRLSVIV